MDAEHRKTRNEDFDRWLDRALRARLEAEPRAGFEDRVLAGIAAEPARAFSWWPATAIAAVAVLVIAVAIGALYSREQRETARNRQTPSVERVRPPQSSSLASPKVVATTGQRRRGMPRAGCCVSARDSSNASAGTEPAPKLATFPSWHPQTSQERMLARLAARRGSYEVANTSAPQPLKELSIQELNIEPMEGTPPDNAPQE